MNGGDTGWRFVVPLADQAGEPAGLRHAPGGGVATVEGEEAVRQALLLLICTRPGERVMRAEYGCDLHRLVFAPNDDTTAGLAIHYCRQAVARWEPRVEVLRVDAFRGEEATRLNVLLEYRVRRTLRTGSVVIAVDLAVEAGT